MNGGKLERPLFLDMDFGEALRRFAQTKPEEVQPPPSRAKKGGEKGETGGGPPGARTKRAAKSVMPISGEDVDEV